MHALSRSYQLVSLICLRTSAFACPFMVMSACFLLGLRMSTFTCPFEDISASFLSRFEDKRLCLPFRGHVGLFPLRFEDERLCMPIRGHVCLFPQLVCGRLLLHALSRSCLLVPLVNYRTSAFASPFEVLLASFLSWFEDERLCKPF